MNAPFHASRAAALRDPFTRLRLRRGDGRAAAPDRGRARLVAGEGQQGRPAQRGPDAVGLGEPEHPVRRPFANRGDPLNDINALAEVCEPGTVVIAAGQVNDVRLYRDLVASGIQDYLLKPFIADQLRDAFANAQMTISGPRVSETVDREAATSWPP